MRHLYILALLSLAFSSASCAASFDCRKAATDQEKLICNDSELSSLDEKLATLYKKTLHESPATKASEIRTEQHEWIRKRNACMSKPCLLDAYESRISRLALPREPKDPANAICPVTEETIQGSWTRVTGGFFEDMSFEKSGSKRVFNSWLHQRPEISGGKWSIENCTLHIQHPTEGKIRFSFRISRAESDRIYLRLNDEKNDSVYKRIDP